MRLFFIIPLALLATVQVEASVLKYTSTDCVVQISTTENAVQKISVQGRTLYSGSLQAVDTDTPDVSQIEVDLGGSVESSKISGKNQLKDLDLQEKDKGLADGTEMPATHTSTHIKVKGVIGAPTLASVKAQEKQSFTLVTLTNRTISCKNLVLQ